MKCAFLLGVDNGKAVDAVEDKQRKELSLLVKLPHMGGKGLCVWGQD